MAETTVAVLGTGTMGAPIARNLLAAGFEVRVWNRTIAKAAPLGQAGATVCGTPVQAIRGAGFVLTLLADCDAIEETMGEAIGSIAEDAIWLQLATVGVAGAERLGVLAAEHDVAYVDAPVLGTRGPAERGELVVLASGPRELRDRCRPIFEAIAKETRWVGHAGTGSRLKMVTNMWVLAVTEAAAEAVALAEGLGLEPRDFLDVISGTQVDSPYLHLKGEAILDRALEPSFKLRLAAKDAALVLEAGERARVDLAVAHAALRKFERAVELGHGEEDMAATYFASAADDPPVTAGG